MSVSTDQYNAIVSRIEFIEASLNNILVAITNLSSKDQLRQTVNIKQTEVANLTTRVIALENQIEILQGLHQI